MSAADDFLKAYSGGAAATPALEELPDDIPDMDSDYRAKHKRASIYYPLVDRFAKDYPDVPELSSYAKAMMLRESGGNPNATSSADARGLLQLIPGTYQDMGGDPANAYDPVDNVQRGVQYIAQQYRDFGDWDQALAAYNWGPGNVARNGLDNLPGETANYLKAVNGYKKRLQPTAVEQLLAGDNIEAPTMGGGDSAKAFLASYMGDQPSLDTFQQQGPIDINQPQPIAKGMPALQPAPPPVAGPVEPPEVAPTPVPFTTVPPQMAGFQPPQKPTAQENLQAAGDRMPISSEEIGSAFTKGALGGAIPGANIPMTERETRSGGQYLGSAAGALLPALAGPMAIPAMMATSGLGAAARGMTPEGDVKNPMEIGIQAALGGILAAAPAAVGQNIIARVTSGGGIGAVQGVVQEAANKLMQEGKIRQEDLSNPEVWKQIGSSALTGMMFGAHGGGAEPARPAEVQHPGEMTMPLPEPKTFADRAQDEALQNTKTPFEPYKFDPEGKQEQPIQVPQEGAPATPQGDPNMQREAFLKQAEEYLGPEKANAFKILMGEYLPGGKNASPYGVRLQSVPEVQAEGSDNASALSSKNSSSSLRNASIDMTAKGGADLPGMPVDMTTDPSLRTNTWMGNEPTLQNEERALVNTEGGMNDGMPDNVPPPAEEVKPTPFQLKDLDKRPDRLPTLRTKIRSILKDRRIYIDDEARNQIGITKGGTHELGPIFTRDKQAGLTLDGVAEIVREQAENGNEFFEGFGDGRNVQATDIADALFSGNQEYNKPTSTEPDHVAATNEFLRNGNADFEGATPTPARMLENEFEAGGMKFKRIKSKDKARIAYKDEYGGKYDFGPEDQVHVGGEMKAAPKEQAPATNPQEEYDGSLFQKGPPKASQEDMFGNKGRVASEGFIKGKGDDKGLEGTPLFEGEKRAEQKKAEEDQQRLFQKDEERKPAPVFYSQLRKAISDKMPNAAGPEAIKGLVKANAVKEEELKWSGLDDLLKSKEGQKLTKQEVLDHLDQNQVEINEVTKRDQRDIINEKSDAHRQWNKAATLHDDYFDKIALDHSTDKRTWPKEYQDKLAELGAEADKWDKIRKAPGDVGSKYDQYQEPGGKNYREMLLTLPVKGPVTKQAGPMRDRGNFVAGHWEEPNVLAHVRFNDRTTPDGKKVLHLEELQSDWHQSGRKKGYADAEAREKARQAFLKAKAAFMDAKDPFTNTYEPYARAEREYSTFDRDSVPDAPFKKTWHEMALRRMLRYAAENGYDYVSWTGGEKQATRYDLSKQVKSIGAARMETSNGTRYAINAVDINGTPRHIGSKSAEELTETVGKELADKIIAQSEGSHTYSGLDLKVGGEGMKGFYDKIVPQYLSKYGKKWGAGVERVPVDLRNQIIDRHYVGPELTLGDLEKKAHGFYDTAEGRELSVTIKKQLHAVIDHVEAGKTLAQAMREDGSDTLAKYLGGEFESDTPSGAQGIPITDAMRKSVLEEGQPLFQGKPEQEIKGYTDFDPVKKEFVISLVNGKADVSTLFHEFFHTLEQGGVVSKADRAILTRALEAHGIADPLKANGAFKEAGAEKLADWWERYLRDGKSPVKELQGVFDKVKAWMVDVYQSIKGTRLEGQVPKPVRQVFNRIIEGGRSDASATPEGTRLAQKSGKPSQPSEQVVGPDAPRNQKKSGRDDFMIMEAKAGDKESGYLSNPEKLLFGAADRAYPIKKIQAIYEKEFGFPVDTDSDLKFAINRIYGAAGSADQYIDKHLAPAIEGGTIEGRQYERLMPAESKRLFEYLLARDALWRYDKTEGYEMPNNLPKKLAEEIVREHKDLAKKNPAQYEKLEKAGDAMVEYARGLANKKLEIGLWSPEEHQEITKNPYYVPEIRYWAKKLATGKGGGAGLDFATKSKLVRGTKASGEDVPVFDPLTSMIHDTHQLAKEGAKHYLGNSIIDMQESSPELQKLITEQEDDYKPKAHEGTFPVRRPRTTHLKPEQEAFAERYQNAQYLLKAEEESGGTSREDQALAYNRRKIAERVEALPANKRQMLGNDIMDIVNKVEESRQKQKAKRLKDAQAIDAEFRALPPEQQKLVKRWMKEGKVTNFTVPIELAQAMNAMEPIQYGTLGKILKGTTTLFKKGTVTWNPGFAMINGMRDVQEAYINTGMPPHYALKGWREFMKEGPLYQQYLERGGAIGNSESGFKGSTTRSGDLRYGRRMVRDRFNKVKDPEAWKNKTLKIGEKEYNIGQLSRMAEAGLQAGKFPMEAMEAFGHMSEMSTRLGVMKYAMEKLGKNVDQAVDMARHATLDFDQRGGSLNVQRAMDVVPFLNPRIQGTLRTGKRLMDGKKAAQTIALGGLAPMLGLTALNMLNPNYANVSDRDKRYSWVIMLPGQEKPLLIPKPAAVQVLFNPLQMALEKAAGTSPESYRQQAIEAMQEVLPVSDPSSILPPLAKAVIENKINKDIFWNRPIVKEPGREDVDQYDMKTSTTMKRVAEKLNWLPDEVTWLRSPERLQHISKTMLGGTADNLLFFTDILLGDAKKALRSDYKPVISRFYKGAEEWQGELAQKQRELISAVKLKERSAGSSTEFMQASRKGEKVDPEAVTGRIHRTADAMKDKLRELGEVNKEIARVRELVEAVKAKNPDVEYRFLRPPLLKKTATPAPSDAIPEASPSPEDATSPSKSETELESAP